MKRDQSRIRRRTWLLALAFASLLPMTTFARSQYSEGGAKACIDCHETPYVMGIFDTVHAKKSDERTPAAQKQCQSCHGPSATHMEFPMQIANLRFGKGSKTLPEVQNEQCLECHQDGDRTEFKASAHGYEHIVCSTCHSMHDPKKIIPAKATESSGCRAEGCHIDLMNGAKPTEFSHAIGKKLGDHDEALTCSDCHNPHGPLESDRCLDCHPQTPEVLSKQSAKAKRFHEVATRKGTDCIRCHKGIAHPIPPLVLQQARKEMQGLMGQ